MFGNKSDNFTDFQATGSQILNLADIKQEGDERPESLYQRMYGFLEYSLLTKSCGIKHHGDPVSADEEITQTLENAVVFVWLKLLHPGLQSLIQHRYGTELRDKTVSSIRNEISDALPALTDELATSENVKVFRANQFSQFKNHTDLEK